MFKNKIEFSLALDCNGEKVKIGSQNLEEINWHLFSHSFKCSIYFWLWEEIDTDFLLTQNFTKAKLEYTFIKEQKNANEVKGSFSGIITQKSLINEEAVISDKGTPIRKRFFRVEFVDFAQAIWTQHFPTIVYTEKSMKELIEEQLDPLIELKIDSEVLNEKHPHICLGLGVDENETSFYAFLFWYLYKIDHVCVYDSEKNSYFIGEKKKFADKQIEIEPIYCEKIACHFQEMQRYQSHIMESNTNKPEYEKEENSFSFKKTYKGLLDRTHPIKKTNPIKTLNPIAMPHELNISFLAMPDQLPLPTKLICFSNSMFSKDLYYKKNIYDPVHIHLHIRGNDSNESQFKHKIYRDYEGEFNISFRLKEDSIQFSPPFPKPILPFCLQGTIVSEVGKEKQMTSQLVEKEENKKLEYIVNIPLWKDLKIQAPLEPIYSGQFYFPLCKDEQVLLELNLFSIRIIRVLNWWPNAKLAKETQGNQIIFGTDGEKHQTILVQEWEGDQAYFMIKQSAENEKRTFCIKQQGLNLKLIKEGDKKKTQLIDIDEKGQITIQSDNEEIKSTQTISIKDQSIHLTNKVDSDESTFVQKADEIVIKCKKFTLETEELSHKIKKEMNYASEGTCTISSKSDATINTQSKLLLNGKCLEANSDSSMKLKGKAFQLKASKVDISSDSVANFNGKVTKLGGKSVTVEGTVVKLN